jgi:hypothetical protein
MDQVFYGEPHPYRVRLSNVRGIMMIMHVLVMELLCQAVKGWILALNCLLPGTHGRQWLRLVLPGIEWPHD